MVTIYEDKSEKNEKTDKVSVDRGKTKKDVNSLLSPYIERFLLGLEKKSEKEEYVEPPIKVSEVLGSVARLYEKVRNTVEYKGEHVLRRNAVERILKRLVWEKESLRPNIDTKKITETLIKELIWARYLPNNEIPSVKVGEVVEILDKYFYLLENLKSEQKEVSPDKVRAWIWGVASSEIEDILDPSNRELYVQLMYDWFVELFDWQVEGIDEHEKEIQIYLAIHRAFPKSDDSIMRYHLLLKEIPSWSRATRDELDEFIDDFPRIHREIEEHLNFPAKLELYRKMQRHSAAFDIFRTIAREEKEQLRTLLGNKKKFEEKIKKVCEEKYKDIRGRVNRGIVRSIIYIFLTKAVFALLLEVPYEVLRFGEIKYLPLSVNIVFPPFMMFLVGLSIGIPGEENTKLIIDRIKSVVYNRKTKKRYILSGAKGRSNSLLVRIFGMLYTLMFVLVFGGVSYLLFSIGFSLFGVLVFFVFFSLVLLFAFRIRHNATQLKIDTAREDIVGHVSNYLTLPFLNFGFFLSKGLARFNFLTIFFDFIVEAPLKSIIEIFEEWTSFIREKKEEVVEMPE